MKKSLNTKIVLLLLIASLILPVVVYARAYYDDVRSSKWTYVGRVGRTKPIVKAYLKATVKSKVRDKIGGRPGDSWGQSAIIYATAEAKSSKKITKIGAKAFVQERYGPPWRRRWKDVSSYAYKRPIAISALLTI